MKIYADNAATTSLSRKSLEAMMPYLETEYGNPSSLYTAGQKTKEAVENARSIVAGAINAEKGEITFTSGGSEADSQAILSAVKIGEKKGKHHIITSSFEHHAVLHVMQRLEKEGFEVTYLPVYSSGIVRPEEVEKAITDDTFLVTIMYANNEIGTIQKITEIGKICHDKGVLFHTDAVQAAGHIPLDVKRDNIDFLSLSGHKFHGPKGAGALYTRKGVHLTSLIEGGAQERGKRSGTENVPSIVGMAEALQERCNNMEKEAEKVKALRNRLAEGLLQIEHSAINGDMDARLPGNLNMCFEGVEGEALLLLLDSKGISASSGSACTSGSLEPSHVLLAIGRPHEVAHGSLRLTLDPVNTEEEVDYMIESIKETIKYLRNISPVWRDLQEGRRTHVI